MGIHVMPDRDGDGRIVNTNSSVSSNMTHDNKIMFGAMHGITYNVPIGGSKKFRFVIPYTEVLFFGAEIFHTSDKLLRADFTVRHPTTDAIIEQYGDSVNIPKTYVRETNYAARLPQGMVLECEVFNDDSLIIEKVGVNFLMHELRDPA